MFGFVVCGMIRVGFLDGCVFECFQACVWLFCGCCLLCGVGCFDALVVDGFGGLGVLGFDFWLEGMLGLSVMCLGGVAFGGGLLDCVGGYVVLLV